MPGYQLAWWFLLGQQEGKEHSEDSARHKLERKHKKISSCACKVFVQCSVIQNSRTHKELLQVMGKLRGKLPIEEVKQVFHLENAPTSNYSPSCTYTGPSQSVMMLLRNEPSPLKMPLL